MLRSFIITIATLFIVSGVVGYSLADAIIEQNKQFRKDSQRLIGSEKIRSPLKSTKKNTHISSVTLMFPLLKEKTRPQFLMGFTPEKIFAGPVAFAENSGHYTFLLNLEDTKKDRIETLYEIHGFNRAVKKHLYFYSRESKEGFLKRLNRAGKYLETMAKIFREKKLPRELAFLPLIESGFRLNAYSPKNAAGLWQFISATGKKYGLKIDWWVDERRDPIKSTKAAAEFLGDLYKIFGSWNLALAAYNAGEGNILRAVKRSKSDDFWELRKTRHIKRETKNYVPSYIAAAAIALDPESFGFENVTYHNPFEYDEVIIESPMDLEVIAGFTGTDIAEIKELNPELRRWCTPPNVSSYNLRIPAGTKEMFLSNLFNAKNEDLFYVEFYIVKSGDTVGEIAKRFGIPTRAIIDVNSLNRKALIISGSRILIPSKNRADIKAKSRTFQSIRPILKSRPNKTSRRKTSI